MFSKKVYKFLLLKTISAPLFTILYWFAENYIEKNPGVKATFYDCLSFSLITQTTIGYGITDSIEDTKSELFKVINIIHMMSVIIILALFL